MKKLSFALGLVLVLATSGFAATTWSIATLDHHVVPLDVTRTATGYHVVMHARSDVWLRPWQGVGCPGDGMVNAGTTVLDLVRQSDGTFQVTFYSRMYPIGPEGMGSTPASVCEFQAVHYPAKLVDRATAAHKDAAQVALFPRDHDSFLMLALPTEPCIVPEDAKHTCMVVYPISPIVDAPLIDTDEDGLADEWEIGGMQLNGQRLDLHAMGANPDHKDLFVQLDATRKTALAPRVLAAAAAQLARLPFTNPDGRPGITLHVDAGPDSVMDPPSGRTWGALSRSDQELGSLPEHFSTFASGRPCPKDEDPDPAPFNTLRARRLDALRARAFRYAAAVMYIGPSNDCMSGNAFDIPSPGFVIADWGPDGPLSDGERVGTFLHELGHSIGLAHGGDEDVNWKPNYQSVMNYSYQFTGIPGAATGRFTYSTTEPSSSNTLDERHLDETVGFSSVVPSGTKLVFHCPTGDDVKTTAAARRADFNCDGHYTAGSRLYDLTPDDSATPIVLHTFNDVAHVQLALPSGGGAGSHVHGRETIRMSEALHIVAAALGDLHPPTVRLSLRPRTGGRSAVITAHDDIGLAALVVTSGGRTQVVTISPPDSATRDSTQSIDVDAAGAVTVVVTDLAGQSATATSP